MLIQGELADFINAQVNESVTKKTFEALKDKVHGLAVSLIHNIQYKCPGLALLM